MQYRRVLLETDIPATLKPLERRQSVGKQSFCWKRTIEMRKEIIMQSSCAEDTFEYGRQLGLTAQPGEVYALIGDLGTGKTVFTKGFAKGLGVEEYVNSPTFTIMQIYEEGRMPLYHFDVYRIEEPEEMEEVGLDEYLEGDGVCLIEWAERIEELLPEDMVTVKIEKDLTKGLDYRKITVSRE